MMGDVCKFVAGIEAGKLGRARQAVREAVDYWSSALRVRGRGRGRGTLHVGEGGLPRAWCYHDATVSVRREAVRGARGVDWAGLPG